MYNSPYSSLYSGTGYGSGISSYGGYSSYSTMRPGMGGYGSPQSPNGQPQQPPNERKQTMEEYFKMMGGLRSIVQLGFAGVALVNFSTKSWDLLKKIFSFMMNTSKKFASFAAHHIPFTQEAVTICKKAMLKSKNSQHNSSAANKFMFVLRILSFLCLLLCLKVQANTKSQILDQHEKLLLQKNELQQELEDEGYPTQRREPQHEKEGYF